jgi:hypothetical protein
VKPRILLGAAVLALLAGLFAFKASAKMPDFEVYWHAGNRAMAAAPLYRDEDEHYQLKYLPAFAILAIPAALLPLTAAKAVWFFVSAALIAALLALSVRLLPVRRRPAPLLIGVTLVAMAKFYGHELILGQVNLLFVTIVVAAVLLLQVRRPGAAGSLVALAVVVKPYAVIFLPWLAALRAAGAVGAAVGGMLVTLLLPMVIYGWEDTAALHQEWWRTVTESTAPNLLNPDNVSLAAMFAKWLEPGPRAAWLSAATALILLGAMAAVVIRRAHVQAPAGLEAALLLTSIPLLSPQGWDYVLLLGTPAVVFLVNYDRDLPRLLRVLTWIALAVSGLSLYDVMGRRAYGAFMRLSMITVCFLVLIASLVALRLRRVA